MVVSDLEVGGLPSRLAKLIAEEDKNNIVYYLFTLKKRDIWNQHDTGWFHSNEKDNDELVKKIYLIDRGLIYNLFVNSFIVFGIWILLGFPRIFAYGAYFISIFIPIHSNFTYGEELNRVFSPSTFLKNLKNFKKPRLIVNSLYTNIFSPILHFWCFLKAKYIYIDPYFQKIIKKKHFILNIFKDKYINFPHLPLVEFCKSKNSIKKPLRKNKKTLKILLPSRFSSYSDKKLLQLDDKGIYFALKQLKNLYHKYPNKFEVTMIKKGTYYQSQKRVNEIYKNYPFINLIDEVPNYKYIEEVVLNHDILIDNLASPILNNTVIESLINNRPVISSSNPKLYGYLFSPPINCIKNKYEFYEELEKFITSANQLYLSIEKINIWRKKIINLPRNYFKFSID